MLMTVSAIVLPAVPLGTLLFGGIVGSAAAARALHQRLGAPSVGSGEDVHFVRLHGDQARLFKAGDVHADRVAEQLRFVEAELGSA